MCNVNYSTNCFERKTRLRASEFVSVVIVVHEKNGFVLAANCCSFSTSGLHNEIIVRRVVVALFN